MVGVPVGWSVQVGRGVMVAVGEGVSVRVDVPVAASTGGKIVGCRIGEGRRDMLRLIVTIMSRTIAHNNINAGKRGFLRRRFHIG